MATFYARFLSDDEDLQYQFSAIDYEEAMAVADVISRSFERVCPSKYVVYVSPVPFDD